eukprot:CAMPEP_0197075156 /NCGR_PEP_ID=MMETSP1384-20130603/211469_1 /TAXON_ID=29189 /ORGANISM="Ammonia sp." /LENGTH=843 /DNA_ID=CAMNT_0042513999 /DNA_START=71 /DNA_END=2600 /DNA_ORIENTATION=+
MKRPDITKTKLTVKIAQQTDTFTQKMLEKKIQELRNQQHAGYPSIEFPAPFTADKNDNENHLPISCITKLYAYPVYIPSFCKLPLIDEYYGDLNYVHRYDNINKYDKITDLSLPIHKAFDSIDEAKQWFDDAIHRPLYGPNDDDEKAATKKLINSWRGKLDTDNIAALLDSDEVSGDSSDRWLTMMAFMGFAAHRTMPLEESEEHPGCYYVSDVSFLSAYDVRKGYDKYGAIAYFDAKYRVVISLPIHKAFDSVDVANQWFDDAIHRPLYAVNDEEKDEQTMTSRTRLKYKLFNEWNEKVDVAKLGENQNLILQELTQFTGDSSDYWLTLMAFTGFAAHRTQPLEPSDEHHGCYYVSDVSFLYAYGVRKGYDKYGAIAYFDEKYCITKIFVSHTGKTYTPNSYVKAEWNHAKWVWKVSVTVAVFLVDMMCHCRFREASGLIQAMQKTLPADHPIRRLLLPFTIGTVYANRVFNEYLKQNALFHRAFAFSYDGLAKLVRDSMSDDSYKFRLIIKKTGKWVWKVSVTVAVFLVDMVCHSRFREASGLIRAMQGSLSVDHPIRRLLLPFTFGTVYANRVFNEHLKQNALFHRAFAFTYHGLSRLVRDSMSDDSYKFRLIKKRVSVFKMLPPEIYPMYTTMNAFWTYTLQSVEQYVSGYYGEDDSEQLQNDDELVGFYEAILKNMHIPSKFRLKRFNIINILTHFVCNATMWNSHLSGSVSFEYSIDPGFTGLKINNGLDRNSIQNYVEYCLVALSKGWNSMKFDGSNNILSKVRVPIIADTDYVYDTVWSTVVLSDDKIFENRKILNSYFQDTIDEVIKANDELNKKTIAPYNAMNPRYFSSSIML